MSGGIINGGSEGPLSICMLYLSTRWEARNIDRNETIPNVCFSISLQHVMTNRCDQHSSYHRVVLHLPSPALVCHLFLFTAHTVNST